MTSVVFLSSVQGYQESRLDALAARLRAERPDLQVEVLDPAASGPVLAKYKLQFGPAILVDERVEFVGVPRFRMLAERIATAQKGETAPRSVMRRGGTAE
ncbi:MAG TPA: hypothetical protein VJ300_06845 [Thermoplasmata archaeon]|nr:hypothetical protein [Thermoplasmata archaeon]